MILIGRYRHRIEILELSDTPEPMGVNKQWESTGKRWGLFVEASLGGREKYQQVGQSEYAGRIEFPGKSNYPLGKYRFIYKGDTYESIEPPSNKDGKGRASSIAVKKIVQEEEEINDS